MTGDFRIAILDGNCGSTTVIESWSYIYDGDTTSSPLRGTRGTRGVRVGEATFVGTTLTLTRSFLFGGAYIIPGT